MSGEATMIDFQASASPPPAGPTAVDPTAPPLTGRMLGVEAGAPHTPAPQAGPAPAAAETTPETNTSESVSRPFIAEIDASEIDDRGRPETVWSARAMELGRGRLVFLSRRMCYPGRRLIVMIHLIDHRPAPLHGLVHACEYEADGLYRVELRLLPMPHEGRLREWVDSISSRR